MANDETTSSGDKDALYNREHPDHAAAVERYRDSFREPGDPRRSAPSAPAPARVFSVGPDGERIDETLDKNGLLPASKWGKTYHGLK
jgi:hypothetical protein